MTHRQDWSKPLVFFDGGCPLCRREIMHYRRMDNDGQLCWLDIHERPEMLGDYGLTLTQTMQRIHVMESDGRLVSGVEAFIAVWRRLPRYRLLAKAIALPGIFQLAEKAYSYFARWRWKRRCDQVCGTL